MESLRHFLLTGFGAPGVLPRTPAIMTDRLEPENKTSPAQDGAGHDVVALMARIQSAATSGRRRADARLEGLREAARPLPPSHQSAASASEVQGEANHLYQELARAVSEAGGQLPPESLAELGRLSSRVAPVAAARRRLLAPQVRLNQELIGRFSALHSSLGLQVAVTGRLIASVNVILQAVTALEQGAAEAEGRWRSGVVSVLEDLLREVHELRTLAGIEAESGPLATKGELTALRHWAEAVNQTIMGYVQEQSLRTATCSDEVLHTRRLQEETTARLMEHITALAVRVHQAETAREAAEKEARELKARLEEMDARLKKLESRPVAVPAAPSAAAAAPATAPAAGDVPDGSPVPIGGPEFDFLVWEDLTRGEESAIAEEQKKYLPWFRGMDAPVLDAGCGRGEFLALLKSEGIDAYGIDADPSMVAHCVAKGLRVEQAELFDHLRAIDDNSLGGLFLGQVVEHIPPAALRTLTDLAFAKLRPGAAIVMETINPTCLTTFSGAFYADPTHQKPVHPKALEYFLTASGFGPTEIIFSAPIPPEEKLAPVREEAPLDPAVKSVVLQVNGNFERLNAVLYGYANYAAAARKPLG